MNRNLHDQSSIFYISSARHYLFLFILWPFLAFIAALTNYSQKDAKKVVYLFLIYYGLSFVFGAEGYVDAVGYAIQLRETASRPISDFFKILGGLYSTDTSVDIVASLIAFIISRFTDSYKILFAVYAAVFGFFYLKSIDLLHDQHKENPGWDGLIYLLFLAAVLPITSINGFRMWTAAWIFFFGAYHVILNHDSKYLLLTLGASLVHWSFLSANVILFIYFFVGNRTWLYSIIAVASFILPQLIAPFFRLISLRMGGAISERYDMYAGEDYIRFRQEDFEETAWFLRIGSDLLFYYFILALIIIYFWSESRTEKKTESNLFHFLLLFLSFVNFGKAIPSFGIRFQIVFFMFATLYVFLFVKKLPGDKIHGLTLLGLFPMILYAAVVFRQGSDSINAWIFMPGLGLPLVVPGIALSEFFF